MKKIIVFVAFVFSAVSLFAEKSRVMIEQRVGPVGGATESVSSPVIPSEKDSIVQYQFKVIGKTNEHGAVACKVRFPGEFDVTPMGGDGCQAIEREGDVIPALTVYNEGNYKYAEFLIPQKNDHSGRVDLQIKIPEKFKGATIPIYVNFDYLQKPLLKRWGTALGVATGIAAGVVVGVLTFNPATGAAAGLGLGGAILAGSAAGLATSGATTYFTYNTLAVKQSLQEIRKKYNAEPMNNSNASFSWIIK
ncbi:MAG: hypothetical protein IJP61_13440 [Treponema sp.]|nr:hypothetical protein [Treponema sp.]